MAQESVLPAACCLWHTASGMLPVAYCQCGRSAEPVQSDENERACNILPASGVFRTKELNADGMAPALTSGGTDDGNGF